jgi:hypothetical protein
MAREISFSGKTVVVRQLTVREAADLFDGVDNTEMTFVDLLMNRTLPAEVVMIVTGLTKDDLHGDVLPSDLVLLWDAVEQENPSFLQMLERLGRVYLEHEKAGALARVSVPGPVSSPVPDTVPE